MGPKALALLVVILNLIVFGILELFWLSYPLFTPTGIFIHVGFLLNILLLIVVLVVKPRV